MKHESLTEKLIGTFYTLYNELGHDILESVYQRGFTLMLVDRGITFVEQEPIRVMHRGRELGEGEFRADLLVESVVLVEFKAVKALEVAHEKQVFNYLKTTNIEVGLLFNFGPRPQFRRILLENSYKTQRSASAVSSDDPQLEERASSCIPTLLSHPSDPLHPSNPCSDFAVAFPGS